MNTARQYIEMAIAQRDAARDTKRPLVAANCRAQMRVHALQAASHIRAARKAA